MNNFRAAFYTSLLIALFSSAVQAQATRTWVSGVGDDLNPCSRTAPCKTFAGAISKTAAGGEIDALDSAGFGGVVIRKSVTIDGTGTMAGILAPVGTSPEIVTRYNKVLNEILAQTSIRDALAKQGMEVRGGPPGQLAELIAKDQPRWSKVVRDAGITPE